nr:hypothetical protein [Tanacetum cinerariifolium]
GADNRPPMLEKNMYDSWKSRIELYMLNCPNGRMILESVKQGPLIWPTVEVEGVTRPKKYSELSTAEAIQADCDIKATNIILQGLPPEVYALAMMSPDGSIVASLDNVKGFLAVYTPSDDLISTDFKEKGLVPEIMLHILEEFVFCWDDIPLTMKFPAW